MKKYQILNSSKLSPCKGPVRRSREGVYPSIVNIKRRGIALIWFVIMFMALLGFVAMVIEAGRIYIASHQLQNAADAAALAGSRWVADPNSKSYGDTAITKACKFALYNDTLDTSKIDPLDGVRLDPVSTYSPTTEPVGIYMGQPFKDVMAYFDDGDIYIGRYVDKSRMFYLNDPDPDAMLVIARKETGAKNQRLPLILGAIFNVQDFGIQKYALAKGIDIYDVGLLSLRLCCDEPGIRFGGEAGGEDVPLKVFNGGVVHVNSCMSATKNEGALELNNQNILLMLDRLRVVGDANGKTYDAMAKYAEEYKSVDFKDGLGQKYIEPDPLASVPNPTNYKGVAREPNIISESGTYTPGYYPRGMQVSGGATIVLEPGDYYLDSLGLNNLGNDITASMTVNGGSITGEGVTLHIVGNDEWGVNVTGGPTIMISAPESGAYAGIAIYQSRDPSGLGDPDGDGIYDCAVALTNPESRLLGNGIIQLDGAVYMPQNFLEIGGTGYFSTTQAIADRFYIHGTGQKEIFFDGDANIAAESYLVE